MQKVPTSGRDVLIRLKANTCAASAVCVHVVIHDNFSNRMAMGQRCFIQISALSTVDGKVVACHGYNG